MVAMLVALSAPVALADEDCDFREHGNKDDVIGCRDDGDREVFEAEDFEFDDDEVFVSDFDDEFFPFFAVEEIDIDCDGIDDDLDGETDEGGVCEVEIEFFEGEDVEFLVDADEVF
jgi:hypothetical protein